MDRLRSTQVAITPGDGETSIQVTEKATGRLARVTHFVPGALGMMLATSMGAFVDPSASVALGLAAAGLLGGLTVGRVIWNRVSIKSRKRVQQLVAALTREARDSVEEGQSIPG